MNRAKIGFVVIALLAIGGCHTLSPRAAFENVQTNVADRSGRIIRWRGLTDDDAAADDAVLELLRQPLDIHAAVSVALLNNLNLQATYEDLGIAQADLVQAGLLSNPILSFERRFTAGFGGQASEIDVSFDFLQLFFIPLRQRVAGAALDQAKDTVSHEVLETVADVRRACFTYQADLQTLQLRRTAVAALDAQAEAARGLRKAGNTDRLTLDRQLESADRAKIDLMEAEQTAAQDREVLSECMGLYGSQLSWTMAEQLPEISAPDPQLARLEQQAIDHRLDLAALQAKIIENAQSLGLTQAMRFIPTFDLTGHYEHEIDGGVHTLGPSVGVTIPIFDTGQAATARGQALLRQSQLRYAAMGIRIRSEVRAAHARLVAARSRALYYQNTVLPRRANIVKETQLLYNAMSAGVFQLLDARRSQIDAEREYVEALRDYWIARVELEKALGSRIGDLPASATQSQNGITN